MIGAGLRPGRGQCGCSCLGQLWLSACRSSGRGAVTESPLQRVTSIRRRRLLAAMLQPLSLQLLLSLLVQWILWAAAALLHTEKFYDLAGKEYSCSDITAPYTTLLCSARWNLHTPLLTAGSGTFILLSHLSLRWTGTKFLRQQIQTGLVTVWGVRLGTFLFLRILREGQDWRFDEVRDNPGMFFVYWTMQGIWIFVTLLPSLILNLETRNKSLELTDYLGWTLWALGFLIQAVSDQQKWSFKADPDNGGKFIQSGLWAYSRHPNYLGEILLWSGLFLSASSVLSGYQYLSVISPIFVWFLLNYVSGIPILERQAMKRWGDDPAYKNYVQQTPVLWPVKF